MDKKKCLQNQERGRLRGGMDVLTWKRKYQQLLLPSTLMLLLQLLKGNDAIHLEAVLVPQSKFRGQNATLLCKYELEPNEELFSLKWYKEETEFYRFTPPDPFTINYQKSLPNAARKESNSKTSYKPTTESSYYNNNNNNRDQRDQFDDEDDEDDRKDESWSKDSQRQRGPRFWPQPTITIEDEEYDSQTKSHNKDFKSQTKVTKTPVPGLVQTWPVSGIKIDEEASTPQRVVLKKVGFKSTGMYRCEVTAVVRRRSSSGFNGEIDGYVMKESINRMTVVELPAPGSNPIITGGEIGSNNGQLMDRSERQYYKPGDLLNLTCTSAPSNPPATLEWRINGRKVALEHVQRQHLIARKRGLFSSTIGLVLLLKDEHFDQGQLRVLCRGTIEAEFWKKDVENVFNDKDSFVKVLEIKESQWPDSSSVQTSSSLLIMLTLMATITISTILSF